ncbi:hypothetical protein BOX15_Mlig016163g1 [Macrostomum lignano]|uniref:Uncharacterized protein n=2 Tax=Macrostomum lignano TaxID=282301 RepID=A0A267EFW7_9PLAT|nr:hypothetical protein BOX15_Mlig033538g1 [Macrostomum lignano]PAA72001.1 hypothetical protein BOX15_Mlig016163g1 [Macrostomum lignano]
MAVSKCCQSCLRIFILITNAIFLIIGDVLIGVGIYFCLFDDQAAVKEIKQTLDEEFLVLRVTLISVGSIMVVAAFCACAGMVLKSRCTLILYCVLLCLIIIFCSAVGVVTAVMPSINQSAQRELESGVKRSYGSVSLVTTGVDSIQSEMRCCGWWTSPQAQFENSCTWFNGTTWYKANPVDKSDSNSSKCPSSCCADGKANCKSPYAESCTKKIFKKYLVAVPLAAVAAVILCLCHLLCAVVLLVKGSHSEREIFAI